MKRRFGAAAFLERYSAMDAALVDAGFHATSAWWSAEIARFMAARTSGRVRRWIVRVGRRGGKSSTLCRLAVAWALWGAWSISRGDVAIIAFVSVDRREAGARIRTIAEILRVLGVEFEQRDGEIEIVVSGQTVIFRVVTCTVRGAVGFTSIAVFGDEVAKWDDRETGANPAAHVVSTIAPSLATQPFGFLVLSSSPWSTDDYHATEFERGDTDHQLTSFAETWTANPTLSEDDTRALEPHEPTWLREYAAQPSDHIVSNYFGSAIDLCVQREPIPHFPPATGIRYIVSVDPTFATETPDRFGISVVSTTVGAWDAPRKVRVPPRITRCHFTDGWKVDRPPREMAQRVRDDVCQRYRTLKVYADQYGGPPWQQLAKDVLLNVEIVPWSATGDDSKALRYAGVRREMYSGQIHIPNDAALIRELRSTRSTLLPSGRERIDVPRTAAGHGDRASAFVLGASIALDSPPQLPRDWETLPERLQRAADRIEWDQLMSAL